MGLTGRSAVTLWPFGSDGVAVRGEVWGVRSTRL
jgi:hypothetical protein